MHTLNKSEKYSSRKRFIPLTKYKSIRHLKEKDTASNLEKIFVIHITDKGLVCRICERIWMRAVMLRKIGRKQKRKMGLFLLQDCEKNKFTEKKTETG